MKKMMRMMRRILGRLNRRRQPPAPEEVRVVWDGYENE